MKLSGISKKKSKLISKIIRAFGEELQKDGTTAIEWMEAIDQAAGKHKDNPEVQYFKFCIGRGNKDSVQHLVNAARQGHAQARLSTLKSFGDFHRIDLMSDLNLYELATFEEVLDEVLVVTEEQRKRIENYALDHGREKAYEKIVGKGTYETDSDEMDDFQILLNSSVVYDCYFAAKRLFETIKNKPSSDFFSTIHGKKIHLLRIGSEEVRIMNGISYNVSNIHEGSSSSSRRMLYNESDFKWIFEKYLDKDTLVNDLSIAVALAFYPPNTSFEIWKSLEFKSFIEEYFVFKDKWGCDVIADALSDPLLADHTKIIHDDSVIHKSLLELANKKD